MVIRTWMFHHFRAFHHRDVDTNLSRLLSRVSSSYCRAGDLPSPGVQTAATSYCCTDEGLCQIWSCCYSQYWTVSPRKSNLRDPKCTGVRISSAVYIIIWTRSTMDINFAVHICSIPACLFSVMVAIYSHFSSPFLLLLLPPNQPTYLANTPSNLPSATCLPTSISNFLFSSLALNTLACFSKTASKSAGSSSTWPSSINSSR